MRTHLVALAAVCLAMGCGLRGQSSTTNGPAKKPRVRDWVDPYIGVPRADTTHPSPTAALNNPQAGRIHIKGGTVMTATGNVLPGGHVVLKGGRIVDISDSDHPPSAVDGETVIDASGRFVTPGLIDLHSHIGVYAVPSVSSHSDGNEMSAAATPDARALYGYWPQDPSISRARAGGVTTALILPGSANLVGGRGATVVIKPGATAREVEFPGAPTTLKMACGENPKRVHGAKGGPQTRMGLYASFRALFQQAAEYEAKWAKYRVARRKWKRSRRAALKKKGETSKTRSQPIKDKKDKKKKKKDSKAAPEPPARDLKLDTLAAVLRGEVRVQIHCYRASEMAEMVAIADEYGFEITAFHHAIEAYKIRQLLVEKNITIATWADWWGFKMEAFDGIETNAALFFESGGRAVIHSDSARDIQRLNQEAAKALYAGRKAGVTISEDQALRWITANPAHALGLDAVIGTLEPGKRADVVIWSKHPLSVYSRADVVFQAGEVTYQRAQGLEPADFELGNSAIDTSDTGVSK